MSKIIGDLVATVPFRKPDGTEGKRFVKCGVVLESTRNDPTRGPALIVMLDRYFNPAGIPSGGQYNESSIALSVYYPKEKPPEPAPVRAAQASFDNDIPF